MKRLDLPNGEWIEFATGLNHAQQRRIMAAPAGDRTDEGIAALAFPDNPPPTENEQIANWVFVAVLIAGGAWLWGGKDPNA